MKFSSSAAFVAAATVVSATSNSSYPSSSHSNSSYSDSSYCAQHCKPFTIDVTFGPVDSSSLFPRNGILTNGAFPGPPLHLKVGECVDFTVNNHMPNATGVHFHGIRQKDTPWSDGVPGLSQYAIQPGSSYNYRWTADESGIYFYHSHYKSQMMDGLYGAIIIAPADNATKPFSLIPGGDVAAIEAAVKKIETVFASDWNQFTANEVLAIEQNANIDYACTDSVILNGKGSSYCLSAADLKANERVQVPFILGNQSLTAKGCIPANNFPIQGNYSRTLSAIPPGAYDQCTKFSGKNYTYTVDSSDKYAAMSFISPSGVALFAITIDGHKLYVYEVNGHYVQPQQVDQITLSPGDRISFLVKLDQAPADYQIRVANNGINQVISGFGVLSYKGSKGPSSAPALMNYGGVSPPNSTITSFNPAAAAPFPLEVVSTSVDKTFVLDVMKHPSDHESWSWVLNGVNAYDQSNDDATPLLYAGPKNIPASDLVLRTNYGEWVDLIIQVAGPLAQPHPIHKHANKFFVIGAGKGAFNYTSVQQAQAAGIKFNFVNPPYVDGYTSTPSEGVGAWMVFRYQVNTPGAWFLHCHVQTHFSGGMAVAILDAVDKWPTVPAYAGQTCGNRNGTNGNGDGHGNGNGNGNGNGSGSNSTSTGTDSSWDAWTTSAPVSTASVKGSPQTKTDNDPSPYAGQWSVWSSIASAASSVSAKGGVANTVYAGSPTPVSAKPTGAPYPTNTPADGAYDPATWGGWDAPSSSTPVKATSSASGSWSVWTSSSSSKPAQAASASSTWAAWNSASAASSTPVKAASASTTPAATSTWQVWSTSATPAAATTGWGNYNGSTPSGIATYHGAASTAKIGGSLIAMAIAALMLTL